MVHPQVVMKRVPPQIERQIVEDPAREPVLQAVPHVPRRIEAGKPPDGWPRRPGRPSPRSRSGLPAALGVLRDRVPARLLRQVGIWQMPRGRELYALKARQFTTTDLTPEAIHEIGLKEVRADPRRDGQGAPAGRVEGDVPRSSSSTSRPIRSSTTTTPRAADGLPGASASRSTRSWSSSSAGCRACPTGWSRSPMHLAPDTTTAYYRRPAADGSRAGTYFVNLYKPESRGPSTRSRSSPCTRPCRATTCKSPWPWSWTTCRSSGATPATRPSSRAGRCTARASATSLACTGTPTRSSASSPTRCGGPCGWWSIPGIHAYRWTRERAIDFFAANTAKAKLDIENEVDRYIAWPGQALAYKIGELKIRELRARAEGELGEKFDVRDFHEEILCQRRRHARRARVERPRNGSAPKTARNDFPRDAAQRYFTGHLARARRASDRRLVLGIGPVMPVIGMASLKTSWANIAALLTWRTAHPSCEESYTSTAARDSFDLADGSGHGSR